MNFFGHAVLAAWYRPEPGFALGAMLPDLAHMLGCSRVESDEPLLGSGIAFHHLTDRVFHHSRVFTQLESEALKHLHRAGLAPGPRRALAHVGLEVLLDAELARIPECMAHYRAALASADDTAVVKQLRWARRGGSAPLQRTASVVSEPGLGELCQVLSTRAVRLRPQNDAEVVERLHRILEPRPRLAIPAAQREHVAHWVRTTWPRLVRALPHWLDELKAGLQPEGRETFAPPPVPSSDERA